VDNLKPDLKPIEYAFSKISEGYAYCKIVTDKTGEPIDWIYLEVNDAYEQINGVKKADVVGRKATEVLPSIRSDPGDWIRVYGQVALTGQPIITERYAAVRKKWYHVSAYSPQRGYFVSIFEDISERKKVEQNTARQRIVQDGINRILQAALTEDKEKLGVVCLSVAEGLTESKFGFIGEINPKGLENVAISNPGWEACTVTSSIGHRRQPSGFKIHGIYGKVLADGKGFYTNDPPHHPDSIGLPKGHPPLTSFLGVPLKDEGKTVGMIAVGNREGGYTDYELSALESLSPIVVEAFARKKTEESLKETQERFSKAFNESPVAAIITRAADGRYVDVNETFERIFGYSRREVIGRTSPELNIFVDAGGRKAFLDMLQKEGKLRNVEMSFRSKSGSIVPCIISVEKILLNDEEHLLTTLVDITERKMAENALHEAEQRWSTTLSSIGDAVIATDTAGKVTFLNPVAEQLTGWSLAEAKQKPIQEVFHIVNEHTRKEVENPVIKVLKLGLIVGLANHTVLIRKDGSEVPIDDSGAPIIGDDGAIRGVVLVFRDITERKKAEDALERQAALIDLSPDAIIVRKLDGTITFWSKGAEKLYGWTKKEALGKRTHTLFKTKFPEPIDAITAKLRAEKRWSGELVHQTKTGGEVTVQSWWLAEETHHGKISSILESNIDLTERKKAEEMLKKQASLINLSPDGIIIKNLDDTITFWNEGAERLYGWTKEEAVGRKSRELFQTKFPEPYEKILKRLKSKGVWTGEKVHTTKYGRKLTVSSKWLARKNGKGQITQILETNEDITERKKALQEIAEAKQRLDAHMNNAPEAVIEFDANFQVIRWSKQATKIFGWSKEEIMGKSISALPWVYKDDVKIVQKVSADMLDRKRPSNVSHNRNIRKDGAVIECDWYNSAIYDSNGSLVSILSQVIDITEQMKAQKEIARLASFPTLNPTPIVEVDEDGRVTYANPSTKVVFPTLEAEGLNHIFFSNWAFVQKVFQEKDNSAFGREVKINNHWYHQQFYAVPNTQLIRIYATDIDELKQTEEARAKAQTKLEENAVMLEEYASQMEELAEQRAQQLQTAERLAAIGQTAGMVGHDIRNPLQAITGDMYLIGEEIAGMPEGDSKQAIVESIESVNRNLVYINKIVSDLQDYTRPLRPNLQDANLSELVEGTLATIAIPKGIEVITDIKQNAKPLKTDTAFMRRMLTNLVTNAVQAMQEEGKLTIKASKRKDTVVLTIEDTGIGIPDEVKAKMFTPLFTTKSKGQGLGLAVVKRLVEALGGSIAFESDAGKGTKFTVELPQN
jgi:PAS domain S-box-containing protein